MALVLFLHGYLSSPQSLKAGQTARWFEQHGAGWQYACPPLSPFADEAMATLESTLEANQGRKVALIGSSMGGFYATWLAERYDLKAVLINPVASAHCLLAEHIGAPLTTSAGDQFVLGPEHIDDFRALEIQQIAVPENYLVLLQTGDEVLDYRLAEEKYQDCQLIIEPGGDHSFQNYPDHLPRIFEFLSA